MKMNSLGEAMPPKKNYERPIIKLINVALEYSVAAGSVQSNGMQQESAVENRNIDVEW